MLPLAKGVKIIARHRGGVVGKPGDAGPHQMLTFHTAMHILSIFTNKARVVGYFPPAVGNTPAAPQIPIKKSTHWLLQKASGGCISIKRSRPVVCGQSNLPLRTGGCPVAGFTLPHRASMVDPWRGGLQSAGELRAPVE